MTCGMLPGPGLRADFTLRGDSAVKTPCFLSAVILFQVIDLGTPAALEAAEKNKPNRQKDKKGTSPIMQNS